MAVGSILICGAGRVGSRVAKVMKENGWDVTIIERKRELVDLMRGFGYKVIHGSALETEVLKKANVDSVDWIVAALGNDADNLYITFKAKELNPKIKVAVRISDEEALESFQKMDVDLIVMPEVVGGIHLANAILGKESNRDLVIKSD